MFIARVPLPPDGRNPNLRFVHIRFGQTSRVEHGLRSALRFRLRDFPGPFVQVRVRTFRHVNPRAVLFGASDDGRIAFRRHPSLGHVRAESASATLSVARGGRSRPRREGGWVYRRLSGKHFGRVGAWLLLPPQKLLFVVSMKVMIFQVFWRRGLF